MDDSSIVFQPLNRENWNDLQTLFGPNGAYSGCWCMWWRLSRKEFDAMHGEDNRRALQAIVESGEPTGVLAYIDTTPVGWCAVAPREHYHSLNRSRVLKPVDDQPVWSITCFFIARSHRGQNLGQQLIHAAVDFVREQGGKIVEAYPSIIKHEKAPPVTSFMGIPKIFQRAGFEPCKQASASKLVMRYYL